MLRFCLDQIITNWRKLSDPWGLPSQWNEKFQHFLKSEAFLEALPGHLPPDPVSQARMPKITARMEEIATISSMGD